MLSLVRRPRYARHGDLRIAYEVRGLAVSRRPPLLLIQGLGFDRAGWGPAIGPLQRRFRLVLTDNRGSGRSAATGSFSVADMAGDALARRGAERTWGARYLKPGSDELSPILLAAYTASARRRAPSLCIRLPTWNLTVAPEMYSRWPIAPLLSPRASRARTSRSRGVIC